MDERKSMPFAVIRYALVSLSYRSKPLESISERYSSICKYDRYELYINLGSGAPPPLWLDSRILLTISSLL